MVFVAPYKLPSCELTREYTDLVGITDEDTWEYSAALRSMATTKGFHALKLVRIMDLLGMTDERPTTKESYLETVNPCRKELESQFGRPKEAIREMIQSDADTLLTYRGFIRFLETDLRWIAPHLVLGLG